MSQQHLFELELPGPDPIRLPSETEPDSVSRMGDRRRIRRLATIAARLQRSTEPLERARLATEARDFAEGIVEESILEANEAGVTWRDMGVGLGVPFQTLYRRYGANR